MYIIIFKVIDFQTNEAVYKFNETKTLDWLTKKVDMIINCNQLLKKKN